MNLKFNSDGLIPAIVQQTSNGKASSGAVLMMAWMNQTSLNKTLESGYMHYWSRSRGRLWFKGETSGHTQKVIRWAVDCDADALLFEVDQEGGACHTGHTTCFFQSMDPKGVMQPVEAAPVFDPIKVYKS